MTTCKKILKIYAEHPLSICLLFLGIPVISQLNIYSQTLLGKIIDHITTADTWKRVALNYVITMTVLFTVRQLYTIVEQRLSFQTIHKLRSSIATKIMYINSASLDTYSTDDVMQMWNEDVCEIQAISLKSLLDFITFILSAALALAELNKISFYFPLIALGVNLLTLLPLKILSQQNKKRAQNRRNAQVTMNEKFYTLLNAIRLIKMYGKEKEEISDFEKINTTFVDDKLSFSVSSRIYKSVVTAFKAIAPTIILLMANFQIRDGQITIGDIVLATSLLETISKPFNEGGNLLIKLKAIGFKFDHLFRFLDSDNEQASSDTLPVSDFESIEFVDVSYQTKNTTLLEGINFTIHAGDRIAIVGESGSGKTTLNNLLLRLYSPTNGKLLLNHKNLGHYHLRSYREKIHYSQSIPYITNATILENLTLLGADPAVCIQIAKEIDFHKDIIAMPDGYNTLISSDGSNLSGGQKKKIAIIRALAAQSQLYVFDEITRGIDEANALFIMNYLLDHITSTLLFTMHDFFAIERMDRIIVMRAGHVIASGKHEELYRNCSYYQELYDNRKR